jgi:dihydrolipoamide dehydrogenase
MIATGSRVRQLPFAKTNGKGIMSSDDILFLNEVPKSLAIIGGGVVGIEFASMYARFGCQVTVLEAAPQILPYEDDETVKELARCVKKQGVAIETGVKISAIDDKGKTGVLVTVNEQPRTFEKVLVSIGREPVTDDIGLNTVGIPTEKGFIKVDLATYKTNVEGIYAIGDVNACPHRQRRSVPLR